MTTTVYDLSACECCGGTPLQPCDCNEPDGMTTGDLKCDLTFCGVTTTFTLPRGLNEGWVIGSIPDRRPDCNWQILGEIREDFFAPFFDLCGVRDVVPSVTLETIYFACACYNDGFGGEICSWEAGFIGYAEVNNAASGFADTKATIEFDIITAPNAPISTVFTVDSPLPFHATLTLDLDELLDPGINPIYEGALDDCDCGTHTITFEFYPA